MRSERTSNLLPAVTRGRQVRILVDGRAIQAYEGETVAAALLAAGIRAFRKSPKRGEARSLYCGIGLCFECLVTVDSVDAVCACQTSVADGMVVETGKIRVELP